MTTTALTAAQLDGRACAVCGHDDRPMIPLPNLSPTRSQMFKCEQCAVTPGALLCELDDEQLEDVALGCVHSFGAQLSKTGDSIIVTLENGKKIGVHGASVTVGELWETIDLLTE